MVRKNKGITLIALIVTIILLLILAGVVISLTIGEKGIVKKAEEAGLTYQEQAAREKLELVLLDLQAQKRVDESYNEDGYINTRIQENRMVVNGNIVFVDGYQFEIDRSVPKIVMNLGKGELENRNTNCIGKYCNNGLRKRYDKNRN